MRTIKILDHEDIERLISRNFLQEDKEVLGIIRHVIPSDVSGSLPSDSMITYEVEIEERSDR